MASIISWQVIGWPVSARTLAAASRALILPLLARFLVVVAGDVVVAVSAEMASVGEGAAPAWIRDGLVRLADAFRFGNLPLVAWTDVSAVGFLLLSFVMMYL